MEQCFLRKIGRIGEGRWDSIRAKARVAPTQFLDGEPSRQVCEDDRNWDPCATDARLSMAHGRVRSNVITPVHIPP